MPNGKVHPCNWLNPVLLFIIIILVKLLATCDHKGKSGFMSNTFQSPHEKPTFKTPHLLRSFRSEKLVTVKAVARMVNER